MIQRRNIATCIILSIVTCGIYGLYWMYCLAEDVKVASGDQKLPSGGMLILLSIVTCSIYTMYWMYLCGQRIDDMRVQRGLSAGNNGIIYLILTFFGLGIVSYALIQNELNNMP